MCIEPVHYARITFIPYEWNFYLVNGTMANMYMSKYPKCPKKQTNLGHNVLLLFFVHTKLIEKPHLPMLFDTQPLIYFSIHF